MNDNETFCKAWNSINGDEIDNPKQITVHKMNGNALVELCEAYYQLKSPSSSMTVEGIDMYKEWANLVEFVGSSIAGQRGVSIDKLNKVMYAVQKYVERLKAFASAHSGQTGCSSCR